ncbi:MULTISPECIES: LysR family transcriptional regulator [unclassified Brevibacterium]|uniref:LysR family transcriptional regulator n=1 Tax=unclassified Brevibacterium TaxID=2614124 RepID=UPI001E50928C|nr:MULTISPECIES: LysR family transcriptional regulator [unclassified Brevibacterium]MCD1286917.1 LysR family transcriptional regulator [Brevibacterium sp. CCUG 69071]MDK8433845.1 LysR family transcriptional regulator [Brevibacterium sp. H-BE7]
MHNVAHLQTFKSVALSGSVRSAAQFLGLSPSAVSHHLKLLEQETGLTLFQRQGRGLCLTDIGSAIMQDVDSVLDASARLNQRVSDLQENRIGRLSIGYFSTAGNSWLPELVSYLEHRHPATTVQLNLQEGVWQECPSDIQVVVADAPDASFPPQVTSTFLAGDPYVVAVPDDHVLADRSEVTLPEIEPFQWIDNDTGEGPCRTILFEACARAGVRVHFKHEAHSFVTALHMVSRGLGLTILPRLGIDPLPAGVTIIPLAAPTPTRYIHALSDPGHPQQDLIADAVSALRDLANDGVCNSDSDRGSDRGSDRDRNSDSKSVIAS